MRTTTKSQYIAIIRAGIDAVRHVGDFSGLTGLAEASYNDNSVDELLEAYNARKSDPVSCSDWNITPRQFKAAIREALEARAFDFEDEHNFEDRD